jgi:hypothetical protein
MTMRPWWAPLIQWAVWGILMALTMEWVRRSRRARKQVVTSGNQGKSAEVTMKLPSSVLIIGVVGGLFFFGLAIFSVVYPGVDSVGDPLERQLPWVVAGFLGFSLLSTVLSYGYFREWHHLDLSKLVYRTMIQHGEVEWEAINRVGFSRPLFWFRIEIRDGRAFHVSAMLTGLKEFSRIVLEKVPRHRIDANAQAVLVNCATGNLP